MIIDDVKRIEKLKGELEKNPKKKSKVEKIEKKYDIIHNAGEGVKAIYVDKHKSKVAVLETGEVIQFEGPRLNPIFSGYFLAYIAFHIIMIPILFLELSIPELKAVTDAFRYIMAPSAIVLNILTVIYLRETLFKKKMLLFLLVLTFGFNVYQLFY